MVQSGLSKLGEGWQRYGNLVQHHTLLPPPFLRTELSRTVELATAAAAGLAAVATALVVVHSKRFADWGLSCSGHPRVRLRVLSHRPEANSSQSETASRSGYAS